MTSLNQKILSLHLEHENESVKKVLKKFISETIIELGQEVCIDKMNQFSELFKKVSTLKKLQPFNEKNHRLLVIQLLRNSQISLYNPSYLNRAKITNQTLKLLKEVGPYLFTQGIVIVSKLNTIHKHFSRRIIQDNLYNEKQSIVEIKINEILKTCTEKKRSINNNSKKLQLLFKDQYIRVELIKELGKLLRDAWKQDKMLKSGRMSPQESTRIDMELQKNEGETIGLEREKVKSYVMDIDEANIFQQDLQRRSLSSISLHSFETVRFQQGNIFDDMLEFGSDFI